MPIDVSALKALAAAGATVDMIIAAVEAQQAAERQRTLEDAELEREALKRRRADARERKRLQRHRDKSNHSVSFPSEAQSVTRDTALHASAVTSVTRDNATSPVPLPSPLTLPLTNPLTPIDDVDERARGFLDLAGRLAAQAMEILGVDQVNRPRLWHGFEATLAQRLESRGWRTDQVLAGARKVAGNFAKRTGERHPESFGYLLTTIERDEASYQREFALMTPIAADPAAIDRARAATVWVHGDDERFKAWHAHYVAERGRGLPTDGKGGWSVPADWPPGHPNASEAA